MENGGISFMSHWRKMKVAKETASPFPLKISQPDIS